MLDDETVTLLQAAKEQIAAGWCRGYGMRRNAANQREVCALGAIAVIQEHIPNRVLAAAQNALIETMAPCASPLEHRPHSISGHNDRCLPTQGHALDWFDRAIRHAKENA